MKISDKPHSQILLHREVQKGRPSSLPLSAFPFWTHSIHLWALDIQAATVPSHSSSVATGGLAWPGTPPNSSRVAQSAPFRRPEGNDRRDLQTHLFLLPPVSMSPATALISLRDRLSVPAPAPYSCKRATTSHLEPDKSIRPLPASCYSCSAAISLKSINLLLLTTFSLSGLPLLCDNMYIFYLLIIKKI